MTNRINYMKAAPGGYKAFAAVHLYVQQSGLDPELIDLVYLRVSLINGCAFCIDMHTRDLLKRGLAAEKLALLPVWREGGDFFSGRERAALTWAESVTRVADTGIPDADYAVVAEEFDDKQLADLTYAIGLINAFNRLGVAFRSTPTAVAEARAAQR